MKIGPKKNRYAVGDDDWEDEDDDWEDEDDDWEDEDDN
jgi:hypothetical protein